MWLMLMQKGMLCSPLAQLSFPPAEAVWVVQSTSASSLSCLSLYRERMSQVCIARHTGVSSLQHSHRRDVRVNVSPWDVVSGT